MRTTHSSRKPVVVDTLTCGSDGTRFGIRGVRMVNPQGFHDDNFLDT